MSKSMKHAHKVNKWLEGAAPSQIPPLTFFFSFLTIERQTKDQVMSWGNPFGKLLDTVSQYTTSPFTDTVFAFTRGDTCRNSSRARQYKAGCERRDQAFQISCNWLRSVLT